MFRQNGTIHEKTRYEWNLIRTFVALLSDRKGRRLSIHRENHFVALSTLRNVGVAGFVIFNGCKNEQDDFIVYRLGCSHTLSHIVKFLYNLKTSLRQPWDNFETALWQLCDTFEATLGKLWNRWMHCFFLWFVRWLT